MVIKKIKDRKKREAGGTAAYIADSKRATEGQTFGPKVEFSGTLNCLSEDWQGATEEIKALCGSYKAEGATSAHWVISLQQGEYFTQETAQDAVQTTLKNLGMENHPCVWAVHSDKKNPHIHMCFSRVSPEPGPDGDHHLVWKGATIQSPKGSNELASGHAALAELCHRHGWKPEENARYVWEDGKAVRSKHHTTSADQIKLGQRIETWEAREGVKHPKRLLAETALTVIRTAGNDKARAVSALAAQGIIYMDVDYTDQKGRRHTGGKLTGVGGEEVKISALPKDCRWIAKQPATTDTPKIDIMKGTQIYQKIVTFGAAKKYIKQIVAESKSGTEMFQKLEEKGLVFEQTGKAGGRVRFGKQPADVIKLSECGTSFSQLQQKFSDFPPYASKIIENQGKVNGNSGKDAMTGGKDATNIHKNSIETLARTIFAQATTTRQMQEMLEKEGIAFTREVATDRKTGRQFEYGKLARDGEAITLKSLGVREDGKALFTLQGVDRVFLARDAASILSQASSWKEAETTLANVGISYSRVKTTSKEGAEIIVGRLERGGITSNTGLAGKDFQPAALDARFLPYAEAKNFYEMARLEQNPVAFLSQKGLTASDIDRIGRVGEKLEKGLKSQEKTTAKGQDRGPRGMDSPVIPRNIKQILDEIAMAAMEAARLAQATAQANRATWEARKATAQAEAAEKALADLKDSIKHEQPTPAAAKVEKMSDTGNSSAHAPEQVKEKAPGMEKEKEQARAAELSMREKEMAKEKERLQRERERARQRQ